MKITFKQNIIKGVFDRDYVEECIESAVVPRNGDYVKIGKIDGRIRDITIDYNRNEIIIQMIPADMYG